MILTNVVFLSYRVGGRNGACVFDTSGPAVLGGCEGCLITASHHTLRVLGKQEKYRRHFEVPTC